VPGVAATAKKNAAIVPGLRRVLGVKVLEGRRTVRLKAAFIIKDDSLAAPTPIPVVFGIQVKNL